MPTCLPDGNHDWVLVDQFADEDDGFRSWNRIERCTQHPVRREFRTIRIFTQQGM